VAPDVDVPLAKVVTAFQRHFRPSCVDGMADAETRAILASLTTP
jgi:N-acetylmuramoyl-L-alanine amidase